MTLVKFPLQNMGSNAFDLPTQHDILKYLHSRPSEGISKGDIIKEFAILPDAYTDLRHLLKLMRKHNLIVKTSGNYYRIAMLDDIQEVTAIIRSRLDDDVYIGIIQSDTDMNCQEKIFIHTSKKKKYYRSGDTVTLKIKKSAKKGRYGKIIDTDKRIPITTGIVKKTFSGFDVVPSNKKQKWIYPLVESETLDFSHGDLIEFTLSQDTEKHTKHQIAHVTKIIHHKVIDIQSISFIALEDNHIPYKFPPEMVQKITDVQEISLTNDTHKRTDLTHLPFITIDPKDARDHDDAVYTELNPKTMGATLYIAIADVSAYVTPHSLIDTEAELRGNSIYLPDRVIPMLPEHLSNNLCSLKANTTRPVLVVKIDIDEYGQKTHHTFMRAFIECRANLTYEDVFHAVQSPDSADYIAYQDTIIKPLIQSYDLLKKSHEKRAPLDLDLPEYQIILDENHYPTHVTKKERLFTHRLIEEFMVLANVCAAETLEEFDIPVVYRSHDEPPQDKMASLKETLKSMNIVFKSKNTINSRMFNRLLHDAKDTDIDEIIAKMVLRCQCQAIYTVDNQGHFGLNLKKYSHFTSPIRRYADLIVHRSLIRVLNLGSDGISDEALSTLEATCEHISKTERRAITAEMETKDRFLAEILKSKTTERFKARISGVTNAGLFVRLPDFGAEGFIPIARLSDFSKQRRYFETNETRHILRDKYSGQYYIIGQIIHVILVEVNVLTGGMMFNIVDDSDLNASKMTVNDKKTKKKLIKNPVKFNKLFKPKKIK